LTIGSKKRLTKTQNKKVHFEDDVPLKSKRILKEMTSLIANADINDQEQLARIGRYQLLLIKELKRENPEQNDFEDHLYGNEDDEEEE